MLGIIVTQLFWIKNALQLAEKQYNHRVNIALDNVLKDIVRNDRDIEQKSAKIDSQRFHRQAHVIVNGIDSIYLDSLLNLHFKNMELDSVFEYALIRSASDTIFCNDRIASKKISVKPYKACLSELSKAESYHIEVYFPNKKQFLLLDMSLWLLLSVMFLFILLFSFSYIIFNLLKHKKLSKVKSDFINNITHEFKTPISTISIASEVLLNNRKQPSDCIKADRIHRYSKIIYDENRRLKNLVERVMQLATLERRNFNLNRTAFALHSLIREAVDSFYLEHTDKDIVITYSFTAPNDVISADKEHISNILTNLLDNAYKYSDDKLELKIQTYNKSNGICVSIIDNGVGIRKKELKNIFDMFYRVPTGNVHNTKGFGFGLYYVKTMIEAHSGTIEVNSNNDTGTVFTFFIPLNS